MQWLSCDVNTYCVGQAASMGAVLLAGLLGSVAQWARGAHFVSHSLWSAYLCALITYSVQGLGLAWARRSSAGPTTMPKRSVNG
jgi:membrane-associated PAP2 superfamily phosphatase